MWLASSEWDNLQYIKLIQSKDNSFCLVISTAKCAMHLAHFAVYLLYMYPIFFFSISIFVNHREWNSLCYKQYSIASVFVITAFTVFYYIVTTMEWEKTNNIKQYSVFRSSQRITEFKHLLKTTFSLHVSLSIQRGFM